VTFFQGLIALILGATVVSLVLALVLGSGWRRSLGLVLAGLAGWALLSTASLVAECPDDAYECLPGLGVIFASFVLAGWLVGICLAVVVRRLRRRAA
jgi:hypothetical protein